jgi:uncharacterized membrane protein (UPF0127 family)
MVDETVGASRHRDVWSWVLIVFVLLLVIGSVLYVMWPQLQPHATIRIGDGVFTSRVAKTDAERAKGLSGTQQLREDQAMLFVYDSDDKWSIWMKGMYYPIDIVWLDKDKKVVYIVKNAQPDSYPHESFAPKQDARYVIELSAGTVEKKMITIGTVAVFDENNLEGVGLL